MASDDSDGSGGSWPTSLSTPETDKLIRVGLMVPPGCRLPHTFRMTADGYPTWGPDASWDELRRHEGGRWNIVGFAKFWKGKDYWRVVAQARRELRTGGSSSAPRRPRRPPPAAAPSPSSSRRPVPTITGPASPPVVEVPPEQFTLREDGDCRDPDDCPGYLIGLRASLAEAAAAAAAAEAREAVELQAALDAAAAMAAAAEAAELQAALDAAAAIRAVQPQAAPVEDDAGDWDDGGKSSDDDDGDDGDIGAGEIVDLAASDDV
ncbi:hypothetical protein VPH35_134078 [Triticum aestivum]